MSNFKMRHNININWAAFYRLNVIFIYLHTCWYFLILLISWEGAGMFDLLYTHLYNNNHEIKTKFMSNSGFYENMRYNLLACK